MNIAIRCDGSKKIGIGHIYRQMNLAESLEASGFKVTFFIKPYEVTIKKLNQNGFDYRVIFNDGELLRSLSENEYDTVVFDIRDTKKGYIKKIREKGIKIISFDDLGDGGSCSDLLIDANRDYEQASYKKLFSPKTCFGPQYIILKKQFYNIWKREKHISTRIKSILITMGGSDPLDISRKLLKTFKTRAIGLSIRIVLGPAYTNKKKIIHNTKEFPNIEIITDTEKMEELIYQSDLIFCSGGITLYEALASGTPAVVISQNEHQAITADKFHKLGIVRHLGLGKTISNKSIIKALEISQKDRMVMSKKGKEMVDGRGLERVKKEILKQIEKVMKINREIEGLINALPFSNSDGLKKALYS